MCTGETRSSFRFPSACLASKRKWQKMGLPREKVDVSITGDKSKMIVPPRLRQPLTVMTRSAKVWTPRHLGPFPGVPISLSGEDADWWEATLRFLNRINWKRLGEKS
ncbi:hypothetical protein AVEN_52308-1 [Araneus ventricosus]|uniref:Uncharacterized protein n=1 Tax=Araneus ventricosus TaxID=182803 RepID=A0A4Y2GI76_ARAVE|nr:hypothetical protein AVEN_52308-1 [Araneus ventricosus]